MHNIAAKFKGFFWILEILEKFYQRDWKVFSKIKWLGESNFKLFEVKYDNLLGRIWENQRQLGNSKNIVFDKHI